MLLLGIGIGIGLIIVNLMTELQLRSPEHERGGIMGVAHGVGGSSFPIGMALTGLSLDGMHRMEIPYTVSSRAILAASAMASICRGHNRALTGTGGAMITVRKLAEMFGLSRCDLALLRPHWTPATPVTLESRVPLIRRGERRPIAPHQYL